MTRWTVACQAPLSEGFSRQEYWSGLPCPPPKDLPDPGIKLRSPSLQAQPKWSRMQGQGHQAKTVGTFSSPTSVWDLPGMVDLWLPSMIPENPLDCIFTRATTQYIIISQNHCRGVSAILVYRKSKGRFSVAGPHPNPGTRGRQQGRGDVHGTKSGLDAHAPMNTPSTLHGPLPWELTEWLTTHQERGGRCCTREVTVAWIKGQVEQSKTVSRARCNEGSWEDMQAHPSS